jgi:hypothetical protein
MMNIRGELLEIIRTERVFLRRAGFIIVCFILTVLLDQEA